MNRTVYYLFDTPPLLSIYDTFGIRHFLECGWNVEILDVSPIINPIAYRNITAGIITEVRRTIFHNKKEYQRYVKSTDDGSVFVLMTFFNLDSYFLYRYIRKTQYYGYISALNTNIELRVSSLAKIRRLLNKDIIKMVIRSAFFRIPRSLLPIRFADFVALGGLAEADIYLRASYINEETRRWYMHTLDYDTVLSCRQIEERLISDKYAVFLDQYLPFHSDNIAEETNISPEPYYSTLRSFLLKLQEMYAIKIVVASHPRSNISICKQMLPEFEHIKFSTCRLVKDAEYVISHSSTSLSFAVAYNKPVILIATQDILDIKHNNNEYAKIYKILEELLGTKMINISKNYEDEIANLPIVDSLKYNKYLKNYLCANGNNSEKFLGEILYEEITKYIEEKEIIEDSIECH